MTKENNWLQTYRKLIFTEQNAWLISGELLNDDGNSFFKQASAGDSESWRNESNCVFDSTCHRLDCFGDDAIPEVAFVEKSLDNKSVEGNRFSD